MKKQLLIFPFIGFFLILLIFFYLLIIERNPSELPSTLINKKAPKFEAESLLRKDKFISSKEISNNTTLVNFFATWCKPCRDEHNYITNLSNKSKLKIIGINYKDDSKKTIKWLKELGNPYSNIAIDNNGRIAIDWGVYGIPETFIVSPSGIIKYRLVGPITEETYQKINSIINESE